MSETTQSAPRRTWLRATVALLLSPLAVAVGLVVDFVLASMLLRPFLEGFNSRGEIIPVGPAALLLLVLCVGGALAGLWLLVWRFVR